MCAAAFDTKIALRQRLKKKCQAKKCARFLECANVAQSNFQQSFRLFAAYRRCFARRGARRLVSSRRQFAAAVIQLNCAFVRVHRRGDRAVGVRRERSLTQRAVLMGAARVGAAVAAAMAMIVSVADRLMKRRPFVVQNQGLDRARCARVVARCLADGRGGRRRRRCGGYERCVADGAACLALQNESCDTTTRSIVYRRAARVGAAILVCLPPIIYNCKTKNCRWR